MNDTHPTPEERAEQVLAGIEWNTVVYAQHGHNVRQIAAAIRAAVADCEHRMTLAAGRGLTQAVAEERAACLAIAAEGLDESDYSLQRSIVERIRARGQT